MAGVVSCLSVVDRRSTRDGSVAQKSNLQEPLHGARSTEAGFGSHRITDILRVLGSVVVIASW
jgi:hypothetical protein